MDITSLPSNVFSKETQNKNSINVNDLSDKDFRNSKNKSGLGTTYFNDLPYDKTFFKLNPNQFVTNNNIPSIKESLAESQTFLSLTPAVLNQTIVGELLGGTIEGIGSVPSIFSRIFNIQNSFKQNMLEELGSEIISKAQELTPIYQTKED